MRTAETCREHGLTVDVIAPEPTALSLADAWRISLRSAVTTWLPRACR
ncbi:uroporphyrinogen-III methyltransferase [Cutibacterium acnes JCM 18918]|nr:uroporphyrinogen-III methyltransferase [Cutibacterium acnes JCM 18918]